MSGLFISTAVFSLLVLRKWFISMRSTNRHLYSPGPPIYTRIITLYPGSQISLMLMKLAGSAVKNSMCCNWVYLCTHMREYLHVTHLAYTCLHLYCQSASHIRPNSSVKHQGMCIVIIFCKYIVPIPYILYISLYTWCSEVYISILLKATHIMKYEMLCSGHHAIPISHL